MSSQYRFLSLPNAAEAEADVLILPVAWERTVTFNTGTARAPAAILKASEQLEFYEEDRQWCPTLHMKICVLEEVIDDKKLSEATFHQQLLDRVAACRADNLFIALGGEHSITPDMVFARMPEGGTVVQIDAHADFRPGYHGSIYNHACPMYRLRQNGYELIQIGIRSLQQAEASTLAQDDGVQTWFDRQLRLPEQWQQLLAVLAQLQGDVWLTIDMDGFDPGLVAGVGTPQPGGLNWHQGLDILETLMLNPSVNIRGIDLVELIPEPSCVSDMTAAKLLQKCISWWGYARGFASGPENGSQAGIRDE